MSEFRDLPLEEIGAGKLFRTHLKCSPSHRGSILRGLSNSHNVYLGITYRLRPTQNEALTYFTSMAISESSCFCFLFFYNDHFVYH